MYDVYHKDSIFHNYVAGVRKAGGTLIKDIWRVAMHIGAPLITRQTGRDLLLLDGKYNELYLPGNVKL